ncbi:MAG: hypothetical protein GWP19_15380 [Planctomycetia bacterium]|nr:hypothetical protein [Planctomycetia bacterium]
MLRMEGLADDVVVIVKLETEEDMVTYPRTKFSESDGKKKPVGDEGQNM